MAGEIRRRKRTVYLCPVERDGATITEQQSERLAWEGALERVNQESVNPSSLATVAESWRARLWPEHIEMTLKHVGERHHRYIGKRLLERMGALMLREVIHKHTQALVAEAARGGLGGQTLTHPRNAVGALLRHAQVCGFHHCLNPAQGVKLPPIRRRVRQPLTFTEAHRLVEALPSPAREAALMSMLISADFAELAALRRRKVNLSAEPHTTDAGTIPPAAVLDCANFHEGKESTTETENRRRIVPLPPRLLEAIENYIAATPGGGPDALLFQNRRGGRIDRKDLYIRTLRPTAERVLGRSDGGWHTFWHCATTWAHWVSMPVAERVAIMNHARSKMTLLYTHTDSERRPPYVAELGSLILDYDGPPEHAPEAAARPAIEEFLRNYESPVIQ